MEQGSRDHGRRNRHHHSDEEDEIGMEMDVKPIVVDGEGQGLAGSYDDDISSSYCVNPLLMHIIMKDSVQKLKEVNECVGGGEKEQWGVRSSVCCVWSL